MNPLAHVPRPSTTFTPRWRHAFWNARTPMSSVRSTITDWSRNSYSTKSLGVRDLLEPARHLPDAGPEQLGFDRVEVGVEVALLRDPVGERRVHREGHREAPPAAVPRSGTFSGPVGTISLVPTPAAPGPGAHAVEPDVDVLVVGAGITGIYQLYRAREAGFSAQLLEAGGGVGGTWYWNRYPGARFDSESYTYAYLFSQELFDEWEWQEHFAEQPETERYLNHVVDRFDLRRDIRFGARVTVGGVRRGVGHVDRHARRRHRAPRALPRRRDRRAVGAVLPRRSRAATTSRASRSTPGRGRRRRSTSRASASR